VWHSGILKNCSKMKKGYILLVYSADGRDDTPFMSSLLAVERDTLGTSTPLERDTHTMHIHAEVIILSTAFLPRLSQSGIGIPASVPLVTE
jgi:hypothetical protein